LRKKKPSTAKYAGANDGRCEAESKRTKGRCGNPCSPGSNVCEDHGSKGGRPPKTARDTTIYANLGLTESIELIRTDPDLMSHRNNVELLEGLMIQTSKGAVPTLELWEKAKELHRKAIQEQNSNALRELGRVLEAGVTEEMRIRRLVELAKEQRKHKEAEARREALLDQGLTSRQAFGLMGALYAVVREELEKAFDRLKTGEAVTSHHVLTAIGKRLRGLLHGAPGGPVLPGGE
jgi:ribosomal protein S21